MWSSWYKVVNYIQRQGIKIMGTVLGNVLKHYNLTLSFTAP